MKKIHYQFNVEITSSELKEFLQVTNKCFSDLDNNFFKIEVFSLIGLILSLFANNTAFAIIFTIVVLVYPIISSYLNDLMFNKSIGRIKEFKPLKEKHTYYDDHIEIKRYDDYIKLSYEDLQYLVISKNILVIYTKSGEGYLVTKKVLKRSKFFAKFLIKMNKDIKELEV